VGQALIHRKGLIGGSENLGDGNAHDVASIFCFRYDLRYKMVDHIDEAIEAGLGSVGEDFDPADPGIDLLLNQPGAELLAITAA